MYKKTDFVLLIVRLVFGGSMLFGHGWRKFMRFFSDDPLSFADPLGLGEVPSLVLTVFAEVFCSLLIVLGLGTRLASIPLIIVMGVAIFVIHLSDPFSKIEMALLYLTGYLILAMLGGGRFSLDGLLFKKSTE